MSKGRKAVDQKISRVPKPGASVPPEKGGVKMASTKRGPCTP